MQECSRIVEPVHFPAGATLPEMGRRVPGPYTAREVLALWREWQGTPDLYIWSDLIEGISEVLERAAEAEAATGAQAAEGIAG